MSTPAEELGARKDAATAIRRLSHAFMAHRSDVAELEQIAAVIATQAGLAQVTVDRLGRRDADG